MEASKEEVIRYEELDVYTKVCGERKEIHLRSSWYFDHPTAALRS